jgi:uncharacterized membrane protein
MPARVSPTALRRDPLVAAFAAAGLLVAGYLTWLKWSGATALFCTPGTGCDIVQASRYAEILGVPTALLGAGAYAAIGGLALAGLDRTRWRRAFALAAAGVGFSGYLTYVSLVELRAACVWCLASAAIMVLLFVSLALRRPPAAASGGWLAGLGLGAALVAVVGGAFIFAGGPPPATPYQEALATHLAKSGAVFYGAYWCPHCQEQKDLFGSAASRLPYVECDPKGKNPQAARCEAAGVRVFPTWVFGSERREGVLRLEDLAKASGFK